MKSKMTNVPAIKKTKSTLLLHKMAAYIKKKYHCHTLILYGSHARGEATKRSDYDIIGLRKTGPVKRDCKLFNGFYLDALYLSRSSY